MTFAFEFPTVETWPAIHALLAPAIEHGGDTTAEEVIDELLGNRAQLWAKREDGAPVAVAVTTIHEDGTLNCQLLGGEGMGVWVDDLISTVAEKAKPLGIHHFEMTGRIGWERVLKAKGWRKKKVVMELAL